MFEVGPALRLKQIAALSQKRGSQRSIHTRSASKYSQKTSARIEPQNGAVREIGDKNISTRAHRHAAPRVGQSARSRSYKRAKRHTIVGVALNTQRSLGHNQIGKSRTTENTANQQTGKESHSGENSTPIPPRPALIWHEMIRATATKNQLNGTITIPGSSIIFFSDVLSLEEFPTQYWMRASFRAQSQTR